MRTIRGYTDKTMVLILDGNPGHEAHIMNKPGISTCLAFGNIERIVESNFFSEKYLFYFIGTKQALRYHLI